MITVNIYYSGNKDNARKFAVMNKEIVDRIKAQPGILAMNIPAIEAELVDTIGAGDTFDGALVVGISEGISLEYAILFANKATSISIKGLGTQGGMPFRTLVDSI